MNLARGSQDEFSVNGRGQSYVVVNDSPSECGVVASPHSQEQWKIYAFENYSITTPSMRVLNAAWNDHICENRQVSIRAKHGDKHFI